MKQSQNFDRINNTLTKQLNGELTELSEEEIALLFDYRTVNKEQQAVINTLIEKLSK